MNISAQTALLIPLLPFLAFLVTGMFGKKLNGISPLINVAAVLVSACISFAIAYQYFFLSDKGANGAYQQIILWKYSWLSLSTDLTIDMGMLIDPISSMMIVVVTFVSLMVHVYSLGYMKGEERVSVFFAFLSLFTFSMLGLVLSSNIFQMYIFWELVGVSSFLLIGFYYDKPSAVAACKKAFIVTRFADLGFLIGILILSFYAGTLDFLTLIDRLTNTQLPVLQTISAASFLGISALTWGLVLVFVGGAGKSAMFPLHIWLPDAMEGPTPVSALIHAATMVVAGVYLVARLFPVYLLTCPAALEVVAYTGIISSFFAALIACTQTDIKRVLAYSTMSQIGYMMFALGVSKFTLEEGLGYMGSMFHLFTHAMFKALLFLGAGAVIHYIHSNEMGDMGGLRKKMPVTHITFLIACLAIAGIPPFAGFFSKEEILTAAHHSNLFIYYTALLTAGITAFYMFRLYYSIFWKKEAPTTHPHDAHHGEASWSMLIPLLILAVCSIGAGFIPFGKFVTADLLEMHTEFHLSAAIVPVLVAVIGIALATFMYKKENSKSDAVVSASMGLYQAAYRKFYIDELYLFITKKIVFNLVGRPAAWFDRNVVDGIINTSAYLTASVSEGIKNLQSGKLQQYGIVFFGGVLAFAVWIIYLWS